METEEVGMVEKEAGELGTDMGVGGSHLTELPETDDDPGGGDPSDGAEPNDQTS